MCSKLPVSINNKEEQSRAIKLALAFDPQESHKGLGRAPDVLVAYSPPVENQRVWVEEDSSGKRPLDTTPMEVPLTKVGQSESPQFTTRGSLELAYALAQVALETFCWSNCEALEEAKETEKKLTKQIRSQTKKIEDLIKDDNNLKTLKAALEGKDAEAQKNLEEATLEIKILNAKFATAQQKPLVAFQEGYNCGFLLSG